MLLDVIEQRHICISLRIFDPEDLATGWEVKAIIENPDIFEDFFSKYPLQQIECFDDLIFENAKFFDDCSETSSRGS